MSEMASYKEGIKHGTPHLTAPGAGQPSYNPSFYLLKEVLNANGDRWFVAGWFCLRSVFHLLFPDLPR